MLQSMGLQRVRLDLATEQKQQKQYQTANLNKQKLQLLLHQTNNFESR